MCSPRDPGQGRSSRRLPPRDRALAAKLSAFIALSFRRSRSSSYAGKSANPAGWPAEVAGKADEITVR
jgi:hypothetical protein